MGTFARINGNLVSHTIEANQDFIDNFKKDGKWVEYTPARINYPGIGYTYDEVNDVFISPSPYPSWVLDSNFKWQAPVSYPIDGNTYMWDENTTSWVEATYV
jgi:hypothetical protein